MRNTRLSIFILISVSLTPVNFVNAQTLFDGSSAEDIETVRIVASGRRYSPRQSVAPGGTPAHTSDYVVDVVWNPGEWQAREEWEMHTVYPAEADLAFTLTYHETAGIKTGRDHFRSPVGGGVGPLEPARIGANFKDLWLTNPIVLSAYAEALPASPISRGSKNLERVTLWAHDTEWAMIVDPATGLPVELTTTEADPTSAQAPNQVVFSDWRDVSGVPFPFQIEQYLNGELLRREIRSTIEVNSQNHQLEVPSDLDATDETLWEWGWTRSHVFLARMAMGGPIDAPEIENVEFNEVGPGIYHVVGSSHHGLAIIGPNGIAMVDAPWYPERSSTILRLMEERWPELPVRYIILTHHHDDHSGGFRSFVEAGATLVAHQGAVPYFEEAMKLAGHSNTRAISVGDRITLGDINRSVQVFDVPNSHSDAALMIYVPDTRLMFIADLFSPNHDLHFGKEDVFDAVRYRGLDVERYVGGHGDGYESGPD